MKIYTCSFQNKCSLWYISTYFSNDGFRMTSDFFQFQMLVTFLQYAYSPLSFIWRVLKVKTSYVMRLHCERNVVKIDHKRLIIQHRCIARFWKHQNDKKFGPVFIKLQALCTERCIWDYAHVRDTCIFISHTPIDKLIYQIYQLVGGFLAIFLSSCIIQNIFFHMIGNKSFHFIF